MAKEPLHRPSLRIAGLLLIGGCLVAAALCYRASLRPPAAPPAVQVSGAQIVRQQLRRLADTPFGHTPRGEVLLNQVTTLLNNHHIVFSPGLGGPRGLSWREPLGRRIVYVKVIEMANDRYLHQTPGQIMEVLCHEAVHELSSAHGEASVEEECDAFAAGLCAEAAVTGQPAPEILTMDGRPLAAFVRHSYPRARRDPDYVPVGQTMAWLRRRTELEPQASTR